MGPAHTCLLLQGLRSLALSQGPAQWCPAFPCSALCCQCIQLVSRLGLSLSRLMKGVCPTAVVNVVCIHRVLCASCSLLTLLSTDIPYVCTCSSCPDSASAVCAVAMQRLDPETDVGEANQCNYGKSIPAKPLVVLPNCSALQFCPTVIFLPQRATP